MAHRQEPARPDRSRAPPPRPRASRRRSCLSMRSTSVRRPLSPEQKSSIWRASSRGAAVLLTRAAGVLGCSRNSRSCCSFEIGAAGLGDVLLTTAAGGCRCIGGLCAGCAMPSLPILVSNLDTTPICSCSFRSVPTVLGLAPVALAIVRSDCCGSRLSSRAIRSRRSRRSSGIRWRRRSFTDSTYFQGSHAGAALRIGRPSALRMRFSPSGRVAIASRRLRPSINS